MTTRLRFHRLHAALQGGVAVDEVETLLDALHGDLLRTLERSASADTASGKPQLPPFPSPTADETKGRSAYERAASQLLRLGADATAQLLTDFEREGHNSAQALKRTADEAPVNTDLLALLPAELHLLNHFHEQRCLLLRCVQQLLAIAFVDAASPLHRVASGRVSLLFGEGLPKRLCTLATAAANFTPEDFLAELNSRLPQRLCDSDKPGSGSAVADAKREWLREVGAATRRHAESEALELHSLLVLVQAAPLLQLQASLTLAPAIDASLLEAQLGVFAAEMARVVRVDTTSNGMSRTNLPKLESGERSLLLATLSTLAAMQSELLATEPFARSSTITSRHRATSSRLLELANAIGGIGAVVEPTQQSQFDSRSGAIGALLLCWCAVQLERAPDESVANSASELASHAVRLKGLEWCSLLFESDGFRHDDSPDEISSLARMIMLDLTSSLVEQPRASNEASVGFPAHSAELGRLVAAAVRGRRASCEHFWSEAEQGGPLGMLLVGARYPLDDQALPLLLGALCASPDSASRAWAHAHGLRKVAHSLPRQFNLFEVRCTEDGRHLRAEGPQQSLGSPALNLPEGAEGEALDPAMAVLTGPHTAPSASDAMTVLWTLPEDSPPIDASPYILATVRHVTSSGTAHATPTRIAAAIAALRLLAGAPCAHTASELWSRILPAPAEMIRWLEVLSSHAALRAECLRLLAAVAPIGVAEVREQLRRSNLFQADVSNWVSQPLDDGAFAMIDLIQEAALPAAGEALSPPSTTVLPLVRFVMLRLLPAMRADETVRALRLKLRIVHIMLFLLDHAGAAAAAAAGRSNDPGSQLCQLILESGSVHELVIDTLRAATGKWERSRQLLGGGGALSAADARLIATRGALSGAALSLLLRMLCAAHGLDGALGSPCALHAALLHTTASVDAGPSNGSQTHGPLRWLALCMLLPLESQSSDSFDEMTNADSEMQVMPYGEGDAIVPCGTASRCLALLFHAAARDPLLTRVASQIVDLAPALSGLLAGWIARAAEAIGDGNSDPDAARACRLGSAATQLLGAAAETLPEVFAALCRGPFRAGEVVRVSSLVAEPEGGWGLAGAGNHATVLEFSRGGGVTLNFEKHEAWFCARPEQLELYHSVSSSLSAAWVGWDELKTQLDKSSGSKLSVTAQPRAPGLHSSPTAAGAARDEEGVDGPLDALRLLLEASAESGTGHGAGPSTTDDTEMLVVQTQALGLLLAVWERPAVRSAHARRIRSSSKFWVSIRRIIEATPLQYENNGLLSDASISPPSSRTSLLWLRCALSLSLVSAELIRFAPPQLTRVAPCVEDLMSWVEKSADSLAVILVRSPRASLASPDTVETRAAAAALRSQVPIGASAGAPQPLAVDCHRLAESSRRHLVRVGIALPAHLPALLPLWSGGSTLPLLPQLRLVDVEAIETRLWRMHERARHRRFVCRDDETERVHEQILSLAEAAAHVADDRGEEMLSRLETLRHGGSIAPRERGVLASEMAGVGIDPSNADAERALLASAASANLAMFGSAAHQAMSRQWRLILALLHGRARLAPQQSTVALESAAAPPWLEPPNDAKPLESQLERRAAAVGRQLHAWADSCAAAELLLRHARLCSAVAVMLEQLALALRGQPSFPLEVARLAHGQRATVDDAASLPQNTARPQAVSPLLKRPRYTQRRDAALSALLAGGGGRLKKAGALAKLILHLCRMMDEIERAPAVVQAARPPAAPVLHSARDALASRQQLLLRRVASRAGLPTAAGAPTSADDSADAAAITKLAAHDPEAQAVRSLARQLEEAACNTLGLSTATGVDARSMEALARRTGQLLDVSVTPQPQAPPSSPALKPAPTSQLLGAGGGAVQMLSRLAQKTSVTVGGSEAAPLDGAARGQLLHSVLTRLVRAKEGLRQQATVLGEARAIENARAATRRDASRVRIAQLRQALLGCAPDATSQQMKSGAVAAAAAVELFRVHAGAAADAATVSDAACERELAEAAKCVMGEWFSEVDASLAASHALRAEAIERSSEATQLWMRYDVCYAVAELLAATSTSSGAAHTLVQALMERLWSVTNVLTGSSQSAATNTRADSVGPDLDQAREAIRRAINAILKCEEDSMNSHTQDNCAPLPASADDARRNGGGSSTGALAQLSRREVDVQELIAVVALADHHEHTNPRGLPRPPAAAGVRVASKLMVRVVDGPPCRSYVVSDGETMGGDAVEHLLLRPDGWFCDSTARCIRRAPPGLCALLWPNQTIPLRAALLPGAMGAMRALALAIASELERSAAVAVAEDEGSGWAGASAVLLGLVETLLRASTEATVLLPMPSTHEAAHFPPADRAQLAAILCRAILALSDAQTASVGLPSVPLATLLLLISRPTGSKDPVEPLPTLPIELAELVPRLCLSFALAPTSTPAKQSDELVRAPASAELHAALLAVSLPSAFATAVEGGNAASLNHALLSALRPVTDGAVPVVTTAVCSALLVLCRAPAAARALLGSGLLARMGSLVPAIAGAPPGWSGYSDTGERSSLHEVWCLALLVSSTALAALPQPIACAWAAPAVELAAAYGQRIKSILAAPPPTLAGLLELRATLRFLAQLRRIGALAKTEHDLREPLQLALHSVAKMLLLTPSQLQISMPPVSKAERANASLTPSGSAVWPTQPATRGVEEPELSYGDDVLASVLGVDMGSCHAAELRAAAEASLCTLLSILPPRAAGYEVLRDAFLAAVHSLRLVISAPASLVSRCPKGSITRLEPLQAAAVLCIAHLAASEMEGLVQRRTQLRSTAAYATAHNSDGYNEDELHMLIEECTTFLRALPQGVQEWVDAHTDAETDGSSRNVLKEFINTSLLHRVMSLAAAPASGSKPG